MTRLRRLGDNGLLAASTYAAFALLLLVAGISAGGLGLELVAGLLICVFLAVSFRVDLMRLGLILVLGFAFTCSWNGLIIGGGQRLRTVFLFLAIPVIVAATLRQAKPRFVGWYTTFSGAVLFLMVLDLLFPQSRVYLEGRYLESGAGQWGPGLTTGISDFGTGARFLVTLVGGAFVVTACALHYRRAPYWVAFAYTAGAALSAFIAYSDSLHVTNLGHAITGIGFAGGRPTGLAFHPNMLAAGNTYAVAFAAWLTTTKERRQRLIGLVMLGSLVLGTIASGSRGGTIAVMAAVAICIFLLPEYRRRLPELTLAGSLVAVGFALAAPGVGYHLLKMARLVGSKSSQDTSNSGRLAVLKQGLHDFQHSPIKGIGLHVMSEAHNVVVQTLASGGLILFGAWLILQLGILRDSIALLRVHPLGRPLLATGVAGLIVGNLENLLGEPIVFVPTTVLVAILAQRKSSDLAETPPTVAAPAKVD